jgi:hypothetical protein
LGLHIGKKNEGYSLSILGAFDLGSSVSLRSFSRFSQGISALGQINMGSSFSVRNKAQALDGKGYNYLSIHGAEHMGSLFSIRALSRCGSQLSVLGLFSVASIARQSVICSYTVGSTLSLRGIIRAGDRVSLMDSLEIGSTLSLRNAARIGMVNPQQTSVINFVTVGSSLSLRRFARMGSGFSVARGMLKIDDNSFSIGTFAQFA